MSNIFEIDDEIVSIECIGEQETIDINVSGNKLFYANDLLTHNSAVEEMEYDHSHIAGGISKINTADNVIGIFTSMAMKERGRYQIQFMKTRSSSGVGQFVELKFNPDTLRITDLEDGDPDNNTHVAKSLLHDMQRKSVIKAPINAEEKKTTMLDMARFMQNTDL